MNNTQNTYNNYNNRSQKSQTSNDNTFNFNYQLDISNAKKDRTGDLFFKDNYDFEDFQNIGGDDKTVKSSNTAFNSRVRNRNREYSSILRPLGDEQGSNLQQQPMSTNVVLDLSQSQSHSQAYQSNAHFKPMITASLRRIQGQNGQKDSSEGQGAGKQLCQQNGPRFFGSQETSDMRVAVGPDGDIGLNSNLIKGKGMSQVVGSSGNVKVKEQEPVYYAKNIIDNTVAATAGNEAGQQLQQPYTDVNHLPLVNQVHGRGFPLAKQQPHYLHHPSTPQRQFIECQRKYKDLIELKNFYSNQAEALKFARLKLQEEEEQELQLQLEEGKIYGREETAVGMMPQSGVYGDYQSNNNVSGSYSINSNPHAQLCRQTLQQINLINAQIDKQTAVEKKLGSVLGDLQEEYRQIVQSIREMGFRRPVVLSDDSKVIIEHIDNLRNQFEDWNRENESLDLSLTLGGTGGNISATSFQQQNSPPGKQLKAKSGAAHMSHNNQNVDDYNGQAALTANRIESIINKIGHVNDLSGDPSFMKNLKMCCIREEWTLLSTKHLQVSVSYRSYPKVLLRIGNKAAYVLDNFSVSQQLQQIQSNPKSEPDQNLNYQQQLLKQNVLLLISEVAIERKSFIELEVPIQSAQVRDQLFVGLNISYRHESNNSSDSGASQSNTTPKTSSTFQNIPLFIPTGILNKGEFTPLTVKEFQTEMSLDLKTLEGTLKPIDKSMINNVQQTLMFFPNLRKDTTKLMDSARGLAGLESNENSTTVFGLFMSFENEGSLVVMQQQQMNLLKIIVRNGSLSLLKLLEFIFTV